MNIDISSMLRKSMSVLALLLFGVLLTAVPYLGHSHPGEHRPDPSANLDIILDIGDTTKSTDLYARAWQAQVDHNFDSAIGYTRLLLESQPPSGEVWLLYANLLRLVGQDDEAKNACRMAGNYLPVLFSLLCSAQIEINQNMTQANALALFAKVSELMNLSTAIPQQAELSAWVYAAVADLAALAKSTDEAEHYYRLAFAKKQSVQNRVSLARYLMKLDKPAEALYFLPQQAHEPAAVVTRLMALLATEEAGQIAPQETALIRRIDGEFRHAWAERDLRHAREMAMFYLYVMDDPALALEMARSNWQVQKDIEDRQLLTEAEVANG